MEDVEKINRYLMSTLQIDEFRTCYHDDFDKCCCRKPLPGALISAAKYHNIELSESYMVGDRWRDVEAGAAAGCKTIFIDYGYNEKKPINYDHNVHSLVEAAEIIIGNLDD